MRRLIQYPTLVVLVMAVVVCKVVSAESLVVYEYNRSADYLSHNYDFRTTITFYPDGLIRSLETVFFESETRTPHVISSLDVIRDDKTVRTEYSKSDGNASPQTFSFTSDGALGRTAQMKPDDRFVIQAKEGTSRGTAIYDHIYNGRAIFEFVFTSDHTVLRMLTTGHTYTYGVDQSKNVPTMTSEFTRTVGSNIVFGRTPSGQIFAVYRDADGPLLGSYRIEGSLQHSAPLITVINCEIGFDWVRGVFLPFIGGAPVK